MQSQRKLSGAVMPKIVVEELAVAAASAIDRIDRRQPLSHHRVDDCDLGVIENRIGEINQVARDLRQDRNGRDKRKQGRRCESPRRYRRRGLDGVRGGQPKRQKCGNQAKRRDTSHSGRTKPDKRKERQRYGTVNRPAHNRRHANGDRTRQCATQQGVTQNAPEPGRDQRAEHCIQRRCHRQDLSHKSGQA